MWLDRGLERGRVGARGPDRLGLGADHAQRIEESQVEGVELIERLLVHVVEIEEPGVPAARELDDAALALEATGEPIETGQGGEIGRSREALLVVIEPLDQPADLLDEPHPHLLVRGPGVLRSW